MIYPYECMDCRQRFEITKSYRQFDDPEACPHCLSLKTEHRIGRTFINNASDWNTQTYNPALGCFTRNGIHAKKIAKERGLEEIGNECPVKTDKYFQDRNERDWNRGWDDTMREKVYE